MNSQRIQLQHDSNLLKTRKQFKLKQEINIVSNFTYLFDKLVQKQAYSANEKRDLYEQSNYVWM